MDLNVQQHGFLSRLANHDVPVLWKELKQAIGPADRAPLVAAKLVEQGKQGRSMTFQLSEAGRKWLAENPGPPTKPMPVRPFPTPSQRFLMLRLAFSRPDERSTKAPPKADREPLRERKLIDVQKTKKISCELTDAGWQWLDEHLGDAIGGKAPGDVLGAVLGRVGVFLAANELRLADLLRAKPTVTRPAAKPDETPQVVVETQSDRAEPEPAPNLEPSSAGDLVSAIRDACRQLAHNAMSPHVKLADLRLALAGWDRATVDATLLELELAGRVRLVGIGDPRELRPSDREAELRTPAGALRNLLYWTGD